MARPSKTTEQKRTVVVAVRLTPAEARRLEKLAHDYHLRDQADGSISGTLRCLVTTAFETFKARKVSKVVAHLETP